MSKLLTLIIAIIILTSSIPGHAFGVSDHSSLINSLDSVCKFTPQRKAFFIDGLKETIKKDGSTDLRQLHDLTVILQKECVAKELNLRDKEQVYNHEKLKKFLVLIKPIRDLQGESTQFLSYGAGVWTSQVILQLNTFITPDNWVTMPDVTGRTNADDELSQQLSNSILGNENPRNRIVNIDPILSTFATYFYVFSFIIGILLVVASLFKKDKTGYIYMRLSGIGAKFLRIAIIPITLSTFIVMLNFASLLITEAVPKLSSCTDTKGVTCLISESSKDLVFADFYKLQPEKFVKKDENKFLGLFNGGEAFEFQALGWGIYYIIIFGVVSGSALFFGSMFMTSQVTIFIKMLIWYVSSYASLLNYKSDFLEMIQELSKLVIESVANIFGFSFILYLVFQILKGSFELSKLTIIVALLLTGSAYFGYFRVLLKLKPTQKSEAFQYQKASGAIVNTGKKAITTVKNLDLKKNKFITTSQKILKKIKGQK